MSDEFPRQEEIMGTRIPGKYISGAYRKFLNQEMSKTWVELFQLETFFNRYHFNQIVELGTGSGVCTIFLALHAFYKKAKVYTFDNQQIPDINKNLLELLNVLYYTGDIFSPEIIEKITKRIQRPGISILYTDNGKKPLEAETFAKYLKKGDILLCHDFGEEIFKEDLGKIGKEYNLDYIDKEWFESFTSLHIALVKK